MCITSPQAHGHDAAIALELPLDQARQLLEKAGFAFSHASKFDIIVEYFIAHKNYNISRSTRLCLPLTRAFWAAKPGKGELRCPVWM